MKSLTPTLVLLLIGFVTLPEELCAADQNVVVVLDDSGSMRDGMRNGQGRKMDVAKKALQTVLADISDEAEVGVLALNSIVDGSNWIVPLGPVDRATIQQRIGAIRADGSTPLGGSDEGSNRRVAAGAREAGLRYVSLVDRDRWRSQ